MFLIAPFQIDKSQKFIVMQKRFKKVPSLRKRNPFSKEEEKNLVFSHSIVFLVISPVAGE